MIEDEDDEFTGAHHYKFEDELWCASDLLKTVYGVVGDFRNASLFLRKSVKRKEVMEEI